MEFYCITCSWIELCKNGIHCVGLEDAAIKLMPYFGMLTFELPDRINTHECQSTNRRLTIEWEAYNSYQSASIECVGQKRE